MSGLVLWHVNVGLFYAGVSLTIMVSNNLQKMYLHKNFKQVNTFTCDLNVLISTVLIKFSTILNSKLLIISLGTTCPSHSVPGSNGNFTFPKAPELYKYLPPRMKSLIIIDVL